MFRIIGKRKRKKTEQFYYNLERYIQDKYIDEQGRRYEAYSDVCFSAAPRPLASNHKEKSFFGASAKSTCEMSSFAMPKAEKAVFVFDEEHEQALQERMKHANDSFAEYLLYIIEDRGMKNSDVYRRALVDKKTFSKIKNNPSYHPNKMTAMCLCVGAMLNLDETKDLLARAGYALSSSIKTDIIFSYFIENEVFDIYEIDIQLEEHGLETIIK